MTNLIENISTLRIIDQVVRLRCSLSLTGRIGKFSILWLNILCLAAGIPGKGTNLKHQCDILTVMAEEKFAKSEHYKINGKHFHPKKYWPGCPS